MITRVQRAVAVCAGAVHLGQCDRHCKVVVEGRRVISTAEGNGPVNALDRALRQALTTAHPEIADLELVDYKVRILEGVKGTDAVTRVLVSTSDGVHEWQTVGVHENVIEASWLALDDALRYSFLKAAGA